MAKELFKFHAELLPAQINKTGETMWNKSKVGSREECGCSEDVFLKFAGI